MENNMDNEENFEELETVDTTAEEDIEMESDDENEVEEFEVNPIEELISSIEDKNFVNSSNIFNSLVSDKMSDALAAKKIEIANRIYNGQEESPEEDMETEEEYDEAV